MRQEKLIAINDLRHEQYNVLFSLMEVTCNYDEKSSSQNSIQISGSMLPKLLITSINIVEDYMNENQNSLRVVY